MRTVWIWVRLDVAGSQKLQATRLQSGHRICVRRASCLEEATRPPEEQEPASGQQNGHYPARAGGSTGELQQHARAGRLSSRSNRTPG